MRSARLLLPILTILAGGCVEHTTSPPVEEPLRTERPVMTASGRQETTTTLPNAQGQGLDAGEGTGLPASSTSLPAPLTMTTASTPDSGAQAAFAAWKGTYTFSECGTTRIGPMIPCWSYEVVVQADGLVTVHGDGYQTMIRLRGRGESNLDPGALRIGFDFCEWDNQFECQYKSGEPRLRLFTLVRKSPGSTNLRFDGAMKSNVGKKELSAVK